MLSFFGKTKEAVSYKRKYQAKKHPLLYHKIPVRGNDWDTSLVGQVEIDLVEHCGASAAGEFINSLSVVDIASGWWEGQAILGRSQRRSFDALSKIRCRTPFSWKEIHPDNDTTFINWHLLEYAEQEASDFPGQDLTERRITALLSRKIHPCPQ